MANTPKLELKKNDKQLARLTLIKQRAAQRTNQRIQMILDDRELKEAEAKGLSLEAVEAQRLEEAGKDSAELKRVLAENEKLKKEVEKREAKLKEAEAKAKESTTAKQEDKKPGEASTAPVEGKENK